MDVSFTISAEGGTYMARFFIMIKREFIFPLPLSVDA